MFNTPVLRSCAIAALLLAGSLAHAQDASDLEKQKAKTVARLYQLTYGNLQACSDSQDSHARLSVAIDRLRETQPELLELMEASPYYAQARQDYKPVITGEQTGANCELAERLVRQLADTPGGYKAAIGMVSLLKKQEPDQPPARLPDR